ncbi:uncharacterized protein B0J16DRAFT_402901 [Fusarium flagelliforme]|uniref:uncharacterized protein n=1 Tax=Fusarium flagelliforme TaxID=2675880 RepID=UPI001E8DC3E1|nr:uncharacterized protein B0J16DRAFT_402901 [Fusarium flagelliforme]KAH7179544.1 hypothetical protein B0J16DRAFT_402901 [Fusarium flagelliforme]
MRTSLFYALNGALGVVAHESLAYFKINSGKEEYHRSLDGCGKHGKHKWVPDPSTFVFPQHDYKPGNSWDLCVDSAHCAPHEALSKVYFDFKDNAIVFDFKHIEHYKYEDVVVYIERGKPPGEHSQKYSKESDHCVILHDYKQAKCQIPYFSLTDGGSYDELCPIKDNGGWRLYIKIKAKISHGYKKYGLYSRVGDVHEKYFTLSYTCAECKDYKHEGKYELLEEGHEKKKYDGYNDEKKYEGYKDEKKYDEYKYEEEKKYNDYKYEEGDKKYKRGIKDYDGEKYDHEHHKYHHKHYDHDHHGYDHDEHHYDHHNKHHDDDYDHEHKHKHHNPYKHDHDKDYEHGHHYGHHDNEHKHYDHGHHHGHHGDYKHHEHYDPSRHHDFNAFLNSYFNKYGHHDYNNGKHHYKHHDGYNHHHARGLDSEETKNGEKSEKLDQKSEDENKHKHHHHGHHHDHKHDHLHKHRHSHYDYHHYEHYDPGYYYHHEYKHHDHKNYGHKDYNNYDHKNYDHKHHDHKHHDHKDYDHKDYDHKHHDHKDYDSKDHDNKDYGHHHDHHKYYEHHDPSYHHDHHKDHDYKHGDKYDHHHHSKRSSHEYQHHGKHHEEPPVTVYYKEKAEDVNAQANHVIYEKEQKHEIPAHIYKKLAEASKKHQYDHEKKHAYEHNYKHIHEDHKHAEENYHQMKLAEAKLSQAIEEYYAIRYGKQHNEAHGHKKHEHHHKEPEHKHYNGGHYAHKEHKPAQEHHYGHYEHKPEYHQHHGHYEHKEHKPEEKHHYGHYEHKPEHHQHHGHYEHKEHKPEHKEHKPEHKHHFGHYAKAIEPEHKHHYGHHEHKPEKGYYEKKEFEHKKENEHNKYSHAVYEHKYGPKEYHEHNKYEPEKHHYQHHEHKEYEPSKYYHAHHEPSYYHDKKEFQKHYNHDDGNVHVAFEKLWKEKANHQQKQNEKYAAVHYEQHPHKYGHYSKRSALPGHGDEVVEIDTSKVDKYIAKAEYNINDGISKAIYKTINSAGEDPTTGTIIKFYKKVEKAIKYIVFKNLKKTVHHITHVDGIKEPESHEVDKKIYKAIKYILEAADEIFTKTIDALGEDPTEKEIEYAVAKVEKLLARVVDKYVREAIIEIFDLEYITEKSYGYYEKHEKYGKRQVQNVTESAANATATAANSTVEAASKKEDQAANRFMRLFMRQDSQNATAVNATADAANATETQTLMRFMRRQEPSVENATEASINATAQAVADVAEAVNATAEAANVTETQTLMRFMRRQDQKATDSAANTTTQAVADVEQALNTTSEAANTTESQHSKRATVHVYPDGKMVVGQPKIFQWEGAYHPIKFVGKKNGKRDGAKFYNGYVPECKGKVVKAYGIDGQHSAPMKEFASDTHPNTCYKHHGDYVLYSYDELKGTMYGKLYESNGGDKKFGNYFIEMVKGRDSYAEEIVVSIDIHDKFQYEVTEARVYVGCTPGTDDHHGSNICSEKTYPYMSVAEKGLNEFVFAFPDVYACDEYFIAIVVDFCDNKYSS